MIPIVPIQKPDAFIHFAPKGGDVFDYVMTLKGQSATFTGPLMGLPNGQMGFHPVLEMTSLRVRYDSMGAGDLAFSASSWANLRVAKGRTRLKFRDEYVQLITNRSSFADPFFLSRLVCTSSSNGNSLAKAFLKIFEPFGRSEVQLPPPGTKMKDISNENMEWTYLGAERFRNVPCVRFKLVTLSTVSTSLEHWQEEFLVAAKTGILEQYRFPVGSLERPETLGKNLILTVTRVRK